MVAPRAVAVVSLQGDGPAVDLDAVVGDLEADTRRGELGHGDLADRVLASLAAPRSGVDELARRLDLGRHLGKLVADDLEAADGASEGGPLLGVLEGAVEHLLSPGHGGSSADEALALELPHDVEE